MANRPWLKDKFATFKYTALCISGHVTELEDLVMKITRTGCGPRKVDLCAFMLRSFLPACYKCLVQAFRMFVKSFNFGDYLSNLMAEEVRQKEAVRVEKATELYTGKNNRKQYQKIQ